ncbi:MAG: hypothetical protein GY913_24895 [Proteobacteria bacterium]|nr:hypothetical protein [Pseudomonadota bacterium]MCP4920153.1 hypothetical protein [Pseudomonadota bacterium]
MIWLAAAFAADTIEIGGRVDGAKGAAVVVEVLLLQGDAPALLLGSQTLEPGEQDWSMTVPRGGAVRIRAAIDANGDGVGEDDIQVLSLQPLSLSVDGQRMDLKLPSS